MIAEPVPDNAVVVPGDGVHHEERDAPGVEQLGVTTTDLGQRASRAVELRVDHLDDGAPAVTGVPGRRPDEGAFTGLRLTKKTSGFFHSSSDL